jgi:cytochrome c oxidase subunit II
MVQNVVWLVSIALMAAVTGVFAWVADGARQRVEDHKSIAAAAYRLRPWLFLVAAAILIATNWKTLGELPYRAVARAHGAAAGPVQRVDAVGEQWNWIITPNHVVAGRPVDFHVTSKDVNHGFAIYDPSLEIVAQTQAMPGFDNVLRYTFDEPGTYRVLCLEYCGLMHHAMQAEITVAPR